MFVYYWNHQLPRRQKVCVLVCTFIQRGYKFYDLIFLFVSYVSYKSREARKTGLQSSRPGLTQTGKQARSLKFRVQEEDELYYPCSENKDADQLCSYCRADVRLCYRIGKLRFSHYAAHYYRLLFILCNTALLQSSMDFPVIWMEVDNLLALLQLDFLHNQESIQWRPGHNEASQERVCCWV